MNYTTSVSAFSGQAQAVLGCSDTTASAEQVTVYNCEYFGAPNDGGGSYLEVTNSLIVNVPSITDDDWPFTDFSGYDTNHTYTLDNGEGVFQSAANAHYYLAVNSPYRDIGSTDIDPGLLAEIQTMTTYAPQDGG